MEFLRLFTAVRPPSQTIDVIAAVQDELRATLGTEWVRWVGRDNFHVTLHFLGDTPADRLRDLEEALDAGVRRMQLRPGGIRLSLRDLGAFPAANRARVIWVGVDDVDGALHALHGATGAALLDRGFSFDQKPLRGHITLGYVRKRVPARAIAAIAEAIGASAGVRPDHSAARPGGPGPGSSATRFTATEITLVRSVLGPGGSRYTDLYSVDLSTTSESTSSGESAREKSRTSSTDPTAL